MSGKAVLIVEDNREINNMLAAFLRDSGWETVCAYNGLEAAANLKNREFAVVLMDLMLPYVGGGDLLIELRTRLDTPVICLSAKSDVETRLEMLRMGADDYILKPFDLDEVLVRMEAGYRKFLRCGKGGSAETDGKGICPSAAFSGKSQKDFFQGKSLRGSLAGSLFL